MLAEYEQDNRIGYEPVGVTDRENSAFTSSVPATAVGAEAGIRKNRYNFSYLERLGLIVGIAVGIIALTGSLAMGAHVVSQVMREHRFDFSDAGYKR